MMRLIDADALLAELDSTRFPGAPYVDAGISIAIGKVCDAPTIEERKTGRWNKLMMYLADLQLTYSPDWGANGCGDEKLYEFITGLIEELEGWEDGGGA